MTALAEMGQFWVSVVILVLGRAGPGSQACP